MKNLIYNWEDARLFLETARIGKISAAANSLALTPVTLSRRISAFENRMRAVLFIRHRSGVSLTDEGKALFDIFERAEAEMNMAGAIFAKREQRISGTVRLAAPDGLALGLIAPNLDQLTDRFPDLTLEIVPLPRQLSLSRREADIAITVGQPKGDRLYSTRLSRYRLGLYATQSYLEQNGIPKTADALAGHKLIGFVEDLLFSEDFNYMREFWPSWKNNVSIHSAIGQMSAVRAGIGIGVLHQYLVAEAHGLQRVLPRLEITREYWLATHESLRQLPRIRAVTEFLRDVGQFILEKELA